MGEPWLSSEDDHLIAVHKPAGVNTHSADVHAQDGMYEWVQRLRRGCSLSILHRLDKGTSGLLVFGKTTLANKALGAQLEQRTVTKAYDLLVARTDLPEGERHCDAPVAGRPASTDFTLRMAGPGAQRVSARPHTGRTHQVRVHAAALGMPVLGDAEHGGAPAARIFLHAADLRFDHPSAGPTHLHAPSPRSFDAIESGERQSDDPALAAIVAREARDLLFDPDDTNCHLWIDRHHDGFPDVRVERLGDVALVLDYRDGHQALPADWLAAWGEAASPSAIHWQRRPVGNEQGGPASVVAGQGQDQVEVRELGLRYLLDLSASATSTGLFLDQREARRELQTADLDGHTVLNAFAHTGSLSVAAAAGGASTVSLDLSKRYLAWAADNLRLNAFDAADHDFIYGDALEWMDRLARKGRTFDLVIVDPPSSSTSRGRRSRRWSVERDLHSLVERAARLCRVGGRLYVSTNLRRMTWPRFVEQLERGLGAAGRVGTIDTRTLPLDHRSGPGDPPYLKTAWVQLDATT